MSKKVMICAGETSGELYGAMLCRELKIRWPDVKIFGIGGPRMEAEGVDIIAPISHIIGIVEVIRHLWELRDTFNRAKEALLKEKPDILIVIDYPDFNIALARKARAAGIPVLYYVSPQVWAWRKGRVKRIASVVDKMAVLFPFEVDCYKSTGLPCEFVGHPIAETVTIEKTDEEIKKSLGLHPSRPVVTLLPGSRPNEINKHQKIIAEVAEKIHHDYPDMQIIVPLAAGSALSEKMPEYVKVVQGRTTETVACAEVSAVASGTATLETALLGTPMVVFYKISPITFFFGRLLTDIKFISLANILSGRAVVKELLQEDANAENIYSELQKILTDRPYTERMVSSLNKIHHILSGKNPSARVADMVGEITRWPVAQ